MPPRGTVGLQCICRAQLLIQHIYIAAYLPIMLQASYHIAEGNLQWSYSILVSSWKNKTPTISTETFRMVINLSNFFQTQSFSTVWNQKQILFVFRKTGSRERKLLNFKRPSKNFTEDAKTISNYIYLL